MDRLSWTSPGSSNFSVPFHLRLTQQPAGGQHFEAAPLHNDRYDPTRVCPGQVYDQKMMRQMVANNRQAEQEHQPVELDSGKFGDAAVQGKDLIDDSLKFAKKRHGITIPHLPNLSLRTLLGSTAAGNVHGALSGTHKTLALFGVLAGSQDLGIGYKDLCEGRPEGALKMVNGSATLAQSSAEAMSLTKAAPAIKKLGKAGFSGAARVGLATGAKMGIKLGLGRLPLLGGGLSILDGAYDVISNGRKIADGSATADDKLKAGCGLAKIIGGGLAVAGCFCPPLGIAMIAAGTAIRIGADLVANHKPIMQMAGAGLDMAGKAARATGNFVSSIPGKVEERLQELSRGLNPLTYQHRMSPNGYY